jgi:hypothetical protein
MSFTYGTVSQIPIEVCQYCERKINGRLTRIVSAKVNKALEGDEHKKYKFTKTTKNSEIPALSPCHIKEISWRVRSLVSCLVLPMPNDNGWG